MITTFSREVQTVLDNKVKEIVRQLDKEGFDSPRIVYILRRSKGRISQILNEKEKTNV